MTEPANGGGGLPLVCFALRRESRPFAAQFCERQALSLGSGAAWLCRRPGLSVIIVETGVGPGRTRATLDVLAPLRPTALVAAGFCASLVDDVAPGDLIWAESVMADPLEFPDARPSAGWPEPRTDWRRGRLVSVPGLVATAEAKRALGLRTRALAVDMESAAAARWAAEHGVSFACLRAVSDDVATDLSPRLMRLLSAGRVSAARAAGALACMPRLAGEFLRLARDTRRAACTLAMALDELLTRWMASAAASLGRQPLQVKDRVERTQGRGPTLAVDNGHATVFQ